MGFSVQCSGRVRCTPARGVLTDMRVRAVGPVLVVGTHMVGRAHACIICSLCRISPPFLAPNHDTAVSEWTRVEFLKWGETSGVSIDNHMR